MNATEISKRIEQVYFGGNCTLSNLNEQLSNVNFELATKKVGTLNTILALTFHIHYYTKAQLQVLKGGPLEAHDSESFFHPELNYENEWKAFKAQLFDEAREFISMIQNLKNEELYGAFADGKYGTCLSNFLCLNEHTHYHLGQIALIKKMILESK